MTVRTDIEFLCHDFLPIYQDAKRGHHMVPRCWYDMNTLPIWTTICDGHDVCHHVRYDIGLCYKETVVSLIVYEVTFQASLIPTLE